MVELPLEGSRDVEKPERDFRARRMALGYTLEQFAPLVGIGRAALARAEQGGNTHPGNLRAIEQVFARLERGDVVEAVPPKVTVTVTKPSGLAVEVEFPHGPDMAGEVARTVEAIIALDDDGSSG